MSTLVGNFWEETKFRWLGVFGWIALAGLAMFVIALMGPTDWPYALLGMAGLCLMAPLIIHLVLLTVWHWKSRYKGSHSKLWGALLILENSGWFRAIYFFRHVLPDRRNRGRYARTEI